MLSYFPGALLIEEGMGSSSLIKFPFNQGYCAVAVISGRSLPVGPPVACLFTCCTFWSSSFCCLIISCASISLDIFTLRVFIAIGSFPLSFEYSDNLFAACANDILSGRLNVFDTSFGIMILLENT